MAVLSTKPKVYITPNGTELTAAKLKQMLMIHTVQGVAEQLGYKDRKSIYTVVLQGLELNEMPIFKNETVCDDRDVMDAIHRFLHKHRYAPSTIELSDSLKITRATLKVKLNRLRERGLVDWIDRDGRTLHLTNKGMQGYLD